MLVFNPELKLRTPQGLVVLFFLDPAPSRLGPRREKIKLNGAQVYNRASLRLQADGGG